MAISVTSRQHIAPSMHRYAEDKLARLSRHTALHDVTMVIDNDDHRIPACSVEVIVHIHHTRLAAKVEADTLQEAIDLVVDKADRQVLKRKDRVTDRRLRVGADGIEIDPERGVASVAAEHGIVTERRMIVQPRSRLDALAEADRRGERHFLFLDEERGDIGLLVRRPGGGWDLVVAQSR